MNASWVTVDTSAWLWTVHLGTSAKHADLIPPPKSVEGIVAVQVWLVKALRNVRFGSEADICSATGHVRFTPNSDRKSGHPQNIMSALPPKADMCGANTNVRQGPKADIGGLFDYAVCNGENTCRNSQAERFCGLEVDQQFVFGRLHHRQIGGLLAFENPTHIDAYEAVQLRQAVAVSHQTTVLSECGRVINRRYAMASRQREKLVASRIEECIRGGDERVD